MAGRQEREEPGGAGAGPGRKGRKWSLVRQSTAQQAAELLQPTARKRSVNNNTSSVLPRRVMRTIREGEDAV